MLLRMKSMWIAGIILAVSTGSSCAQEACSKADVSARAAAVAGIRGQLRAIKVDEDGDPEVSVSVQSLIRRLKNALADAVTAEMVCAKEDEDARTIEAQLAKELTANLPEKPVQPYVSKSDETPVSEDNVYGADLKVAVATPANAAQLRIIQVGFGIPCGDDTVLMIYAPGPEGWRQALRWQSPAYKEISGAFGDFFLTAILPATAGSGWQAVAAHGTPWCTSRLSGFKMDVLKPAAGKTAPEVVWHADRGYSRGDATAKLRATGDGFELRLNDVGLDFINGYERPVIYHYRGAGEQVTRVEPIAANGRGFVEEWLSMPWNEAAGQTAPQAVARMKVVHDRVESMDKDAKTYVSFTYGPVRSCLAKGRYEVEMDADPGRPEFFAIAETGNGYMMMNYGTTQDERCSGPDLKKKK
jgi:hypothetical protein